MCVFRRASVNFVLYPPKKKLECPFKKYIEIWMCIVPFMNGLFYELCWFLQIRILYFPMKIYPPVISSMAGESTEVSPWFSQLPIARPRKFPMFDWAWSAKPKLTFQVTYSQNLPEFHQLKPWSKHGSEMWKNTKIDDFNLINDPIYY